MDIAQQLMAFIANPNVAYVALIVGLLMLVVAVTTPGTGFAEVIAVIALAVAVIGLIQLSANFAGVVLIIAAFVLFALDVTQTSHGALTLGGAVALVVGSLLLFPAREVGTVKELVQQSLAAWLLDPERRLAIVDSDVTGGESPTFSAPHAVVELVLSSQDPAMTRAILPELDIRLRRSADFLDLYSPLRLSEEADLIVAKVNGQRTAGEIAGRSPHGHDDVINLLAALVAAGMLEPAPAEEAAEAPVPVAVDEPPARRSRLRRVPPWWLLAALAAVLTLVLLIALVWQRSDASVGNPGSGAEWGLVVDMGCEPQELQRVLGKVRQYPDGLRAVEAAGAEGSPCWRLSWGRFPSREAASRAIADIPAHLKLEGFTPHAVELPPETETNAAGRGGG